jgi:hypothetical protein
MRLDEQPGPMAPAHSTDLLHAGMRLIVDGDANR